MGKRYRQDIELILTFYFVPKLTLNISTDFMTEIVKFYPEVLSKVVFVLLRISKWLLRLHAGLLYRRQLADLTQPWWRMREMTDRTLLTPRPHYLHQHQPWDTFLCSGPALVLRFYKVPVTLNFGNRTGRRHRQRDTTGGRRLSRWWWCECHLTAPSLHLPSDVTITQDQHHHQATPLTPLSPLSPRSCRYFYYFLNPKVLSKLDFTFPPPQRYLASV